MSLWESRVPSCPFGPLWGRFHIPFFGGGGQCPFGVSHIPLGGAHIPLGGSHIPLWVPCPLLSLRSPWGSVSPFVPQMLYGGVPHFFGGVPHPFGGGLMSLWGSRVPYCPFGPFGVSHIPLGEVPYPFGGSYVPSCPLGPCWGAPMSLLGSCVPSHTLGPFGGVLCPFWGPVSPPIP